MIRRQDHLLQGPMVRLDFNKGTQANEHKEFDRSKSRSCGVESWTDRHTTEAD